MNLDRNILLFLQEHVRNPLLNTLLIPFTLSNNAGIICFVIIAIFLYFKKLRKTGILMGISLALEFLLTNLVIKNAVARVRPYEVISGLNLIVGEATDYSFPSGHTGSAFALAVAVFMVMPKKYGFTALFPASLMGFSRLYVGIHYPSDVLGGVILGIISAVIAVRCFRNRIESLPFVS